MPDDVAVGKLMVDMDKLGFGPKDGHDPKDLRYIAEFVKKYVVDIFKKYYQNNLEKLEMDRNRFHGIVGGVGRPVLKPPGGSPGMEPAEPFAPG
jgi:hypothetical protein